MNPLRVTASNYRTFADLDLGLPGGCTAVIGPNGAGKSSILNLIDVALFADRGELPALLTTDEERLDLQLEFEHAGELYRVRRTYSASGRGKAILDFERNALRDRDDELGLRDDSWVPLTRETTSQTQELIEQTLGLSRTTFRASAFLAQGDGAAFTDAAPRDRKAILAEILGLGIWDRLLEKARVDLRVVETDLSSSAAVVERLGQVVAQQVAATVARDEARRQRDGASLLVADAEEQLERSQARLAVVAAAQERVLARKAEVETARSVHTAAVEKLRGAVAAGQLVADARVELEEVAADAARIPSLERQVELLRAAAREAAEARRRRDELAAQVGQREQARQRLVDEALNLHAAAMDAHAKANHLDAHIGDAGACDRCGQTLGAEAAARAAASFRADAAQLGQRAGQIDQQTEADLAEIAAMHEQLAAIAAPEPVDDPAPVEEQLAAARTAAEKRGQLHERISHLDQTAARRGEFEQAAAAALADLEHRQADLDVAAAQVGDLPSAELAVEVAKRTVRDTRAALEQHAVALARAEQQLEQIAAAQAELDQLHAATKDLQQRLDVLKLAEKAYGRDGIPALILEASAIPQIEVEANRILAELGTSYIVELRTQRENKTNANLRETLDVIVYDASNARPYETFSGGERTRINLAVRLALASLLAHRRGAESRVLCIDEPDGLDAAGMDALVDVLRRLSSTFERVIVVSHQPQLASSFDQRIEIEKVDGRSRIAAGAAVAVEAVAS